MLVGTLSNYYFLACRECINLLTSSEHNCALQYARETESMLAQQRKENRGNIFVLCPHVQVTAVAVCFCLPSFQ